MSARAHGCRLLNKIYSLAFTQGAGRIDLPTLIKEWDNEALKLCIPFYDSFIYARDKYGPEKYFVWYNNWYSTEDIPGDDNIGENRGATIIKEDPKPLIIRKQKIEV